jgi:hypothetical protein
MESTFEIAKHIKLVILSTTAEVMNYSSWSESFSVSQIRDLPARIKGSDWYRDINPAELTKDEMQILGFGLWSDDPIFLIPLWLFPFLADTIKCVDINGGAVLRKSDMSDDNRFGYLAYGIMPKTEG